MDPIIVNEEYRRLVHEIQHGEIDQRWQAARILGEKGEMYVDPLLGLLYHDDPGIRILVLWALGRTRSTRIVAQIERMLEDEDIEVRTACEGAIQRICGRRNPFIPEKKT